MITNFEDTGLDMIDIWISKNMNSGICEIELRECLKSINVSFVLEEIDRVQSTLICELKGSYVQQSQRYVAQKGEDFMMEGLEHEDSIKAQELLSKAFELYEEMSKTKDATIKGRPKAENYVYGIPIEDARYILPLGSKTNITVSLSGDRLIDLFILMNDIKYTGIFNDIENELIKLLPSNLATILASIHKDCNSKLVENFYNDYFEKINSHDNMVLLNSFSNLDLKVGLGAITSTNKNTPSQVLKLWGDNASSKAEAVTNRVLGYGHDSIAEQARTTFGMMCSLVTYHQQIRHRLSENHRENLINIINDKDRPVVVPSTIKNSIFYNEFLQLTDKIKIFRSYILSKYNQNSVLRLLLNCDQIKMIISTNARIDVGMLAERICFNAQWEIRELYTKKLDILRAQSLVLYKNALPPCVYGKCKEGKLTCGKQEQMREKFIYND